MNPPLHPFYERSLDIMRKQPEVLAAYMTGSAGTSREDDFSDVDPVFVVAPDAFPAFDARLPGLFREMGMEPILWWPERGNSDSVRNYAVFFEHEDLIQYDVTIQAAPEGGMRMTADRVLFDKAGVFMAADLTPAGGCDISRLVWRIEMYWIYIYIHAKYIQRGDIYKLLAVQRELFDCHLHVLHALHPQEPWDWWPILVKHVASPTDWEHLLEYMRHTTTEAIGKALPDEMTAFAGSAQAACELHGLEYPAIFAVKAASHLMECMKKAG